MKIDLENCLELIEASRTATQSEMFNEANDLSRIYSFSKSPTGGVICSPFGAFPDPYEGLAMFAHETSKDVIALAVTCSGWGAEGTGDAPEQIAPSEHPDRESVRLELVVSVSNEWFTRLSFPENQEREDLVSASSTEDHVVAGDLLEAIRASLHFHRLSEEDMKSIYEGFRKILDDIDEGTTLEE